MEHDLKVGSQAPDFTLPDEMGTIHTLSSMRGNKIAVYFYPKDNTPGCTKEACSLRDGYSLLHDAGISVWGISYDSPASHLEFKKKNHLPFPLLSDETKAVAGKYGVQGWFFPQRVTFLINQEGIIVQILNDINVSDHASQIIAAFK